MLQAKGIPGFVAYGAVIGEVLAPLLIIVGFRTKIAALLMAFTMVIAVVLVHSNHLFALSPTGGWAIELPALYFFASIALFFSGAGRIAISKSSKWD
jgi:putative oxidoreductase